MDQADEIDVLFELGDQVAFSDLFMKKIVEELDVRIADGTNNFKTFRRRSEEVLGVLFGIDVLNEELDVVLRGDFPAALQGFDTVGAHLLGTHTGNSVASLQDETIAFELFHQGKEVAEGLEEWFTVGGIR